MNVVLKDMKESVELRGLKVTKEHLVIVESVVIKVHKENVVLRVIEAQEVMKVHKEKKVRWELLDLKDQEVLKENVELRVLKEMKVL